MILRPIEPEDAPRLRKLTDILGAPAPKTPALGFCAAEGETLAGALLLCPDEGGAAVLCGVRPSHRNRGLAALLLRLADDWAWENGCARLHAALPKEDLIARRVFERGGYLRTGFRRGVPGPDGRLTDLLLLEKPTPPREA